MTQQIYSLPHLATLESTHCVMFLSLLSDSNQRPRDYKSRALANWAKEASIVVQRDTGRSLLRVQNYNHFLNWQTFLNFFFKKLLALRFKNLTRCWNSTFCRLQINLSSLAVALAPPNSPILYIMWMACQAHSRPMKLYASGLIGSLLVPHNSRSMNSFFDCLCFI